MNGMRAIALGLLLCAAVSCGKKAPEAPPSPPPAREEAPKGPPPPRIEGNVAGLDASKDLSADLKSLVERTFEAMGKDPARFGEIVASFALPHPDEWTAATFGDAGKPFAQKLKAEAPQFEEEVKWTIEALFADNRKKVQVVRHVAADDPKATDVQRQLIAAMKAPCALYSVNFRVDDDDPGQSVWSWVYVEGGFRLVGHLK
jgi:hypothetical protein